MFSRFRRTAQEGPAAGSPSPAGDKMAAPPAPLPKAAALETAAALPVIPQQLPANSPAKIRAAALGEIVALLIDSAGHRSLALADIERRILPAIGLGQFSIAYAKHNGSPDALPAAAVLWANVSDAIDQALSNSGDQPHALGPADWTSGSNTWIVETIGNPAAVQNVLTRLVQTKLTGKAPKIRVRGNDGKPAVARLQITGAV